MSIGDFEQALKKNTVANEIICCILQINHAEVGSTQHSATSFSAN